MDESAEPQPQIFDVAADWAFPELGAKAVPPGSRVDVVVDEAAWTGYDTAGGDLARHGAALSVADGVRWQLLLDGAVTTATAAGPAVPAPLSDVLLGVRAGYALRAGPTRHRERVTRVVLSADDVLLGEIDDVTERAPDGTQRWVEVIAGDAGFGAAVGQQLVKAGARRREADVAGSDGSLGAALREFIAAREADILRGDARLRRGAAVVHPTRVAIRRLRSIIRVVDVFEADRATRLDAELSWFAQVLGAVRDLEVLGAHFAAAAESLAAAGAGDRAEAHHDAGPAAVRAAGNAIAAVLAADVAVAQRRLAAALKGRRYLALLRELRRWSDDPPFTAPVTRSASASGKYARAAQRTMRRRVRRADDAASSHRARKAAKRARYVAEFAQPYTKDDLGPMVSAAKHVQTELGERQDAAVAARFLAGLVRRGGLGGPAAFGCGVLWTAEMRRAGPGG